jgi:hypothetical protein
MALVGTINPGNSLGFKNVVINGAFDIWQRRTSGSTAASFVADRWILNSNNTSHARSSDVPTGFKYSLLMTGTSAENAQATQKIESLNCNALVGKPITISFWAKSTAGSTTLGVYASHPTATDNFTSTTAIGSTSFALTSTWTRYSFVLTTSAPAGTANGIQLGLFRSGTESSTTYITGVQLEDSSVATPFEFRPSTVELILCQRYYEKSWNQSDPIGSAHGVQVSIRISTSAGFTNYLLLSSPYKVTKRITNPTVIVYDSSGNAGKININDSISDPNNITPSSYGTVGDWGVQAVYGASCNGMSYAWSSSAEL